MSVFKISSKYDTAFPDVSLQNARVGVHEAEPVAAWPSEQPASFLLHSELLLLDDAVNDVSSGMTNICLRFINYPRTSFNRFVNDI